MTSIEIFLALICLALACVIAFLFRVLYNTGMIVLNVQDVLEESLEVIDARIDSIDIVLAIPLFSDSPEIKRIQKDMLDCREAVLDVANSLSKTAGEKDSLEKE